VAPGNLDVVPLLLHVRLPVNDQHLFFLQQQVAVVIAEVVGVSLLYAKGVDELVVHGSLIPPPAATCRWISIRLS
jgi:hypothetical protein